MSTAFAARHPGFVRALATSFVALAALFALVWAAPRASGAAAAWLRAPAVRLQTLRPSGEELRVSLTGAHTADPAGGTGAPVTLEAGDRFTMAAVVADAPSAGPVTIRLRTSLDGAAWSRWYAAPLERADDHGSDTTFTDPIWTGDARYVQVAASRGSRRAPSRLAGVRLVAIDPTERSDLAARLTGAVRHVAAAVAGISLEQTAMAASTAPAIVSRAGWGADESLRSGSPSYAPVKMAFVHHTASGNTYTQADAPALVRGIYAYHTRSLGWSDIGYNFLIDRFGTIYEGRYGGMSRGVVGAQVYGFNTGSTGVSVMGTFTDEAPSPEAVEALERLLAWKLGVAGLDPGGTAQLTSGATDKYARGTTVTFPVIAGHRQANYTECPGDQLYALLPALRVDVAGRMGAAALVPTLRVSGPVLSPNGDGILDTVDLSVAVSSPADWRLVLRDADGRSVAAWSGQGDAAIVTWNGTSGGSRVPDGAYSAQLTAGTAAASATVTVDTVAPRLASAAASPSSFSPNGDGEAESSAISYAPAEACSVRVGILAENGDVVRWLHGWRARAASTYTVRWDGRLSSVGGLVPAPDGLYRFDVERRDGAGNIARRGVSVMVDRTLGSPAAAPPTFSPNGDGVLDSTALSFKLTRTAAVTVDVAVGDEVVRTFSLGTLAAGRQTAQWDGRAGSGEYLASTRPVFTVTAVSAIGESTVTAGLVVDLYRPRVYAATGKTTSVGVTTRLSFKVSDPYSPQADVRYVVTDAGGRRVASGRPGRVATGSTQYVSWKPAARGVYTVTFHATDLAGNGEAGPATTVVTVR